MPKRAKQAEPEPEETPPPRKGRARVSVPRGGVENRLREEQPDSRPNGKYRLGKRWTQIIQEVADGQYTWDEFVEELSPEELARGQLKDRNDRFQGRPPALVPRHFQQACLKEIHRRFNEKIQERLLDAVDEMINLSRAGGGMESKDRAKLLIYLTERVMGPIPKQVVIQGADEPWQGMMTKGFTRPAVDPKADGPAGPPPRSHDRYNKRRKFVPAEEDVDD